MREAGLHYALACVALLLSLVAAGNSELLMLERPAMRRGLGVVPDLRSSDPVRDATGTLVPRRNYQRIVLMEGVDHVLSLVPAERVVGVESWAVDHSNDGWRIAHVPRISELRGIEKILSCRPDLVVTCSAGNPEARENIACLRHLGVAVFDLSYTISLDDMFAQIASLSAVLQVPDRGLAVQKLIAARCALLTMPLHSEQAAARGLFINTWGERVSVGGSDDVFDAMLRGSGLRNAGGEAGLHLMPVVSVETALKVNPEVLVTRQRNLRSLWGLGVIRDLVGGRKSRVANIPEPYLGNAVPLDLVDTMEAIQDQLFRASDHK